MNVQLPPDQQESIEKALEEANTAVKELTNKLPAVNAAAAAAAAAATSTSSSTSSRLEESNQGELPPQDQLMQAHIILEEQLRTMTQWQQKCGELKASILEMQTNPAK